MIVANGIGEVRMPDAEEHHDSGLVRGVFKGPMNGERGQNEDCSGYARRAHRTCPVAPSLPDVFERRPPRLGQARIHLVPNVYVVTRIE